jgi:hypothetical protein
MKRNKNKLAIVAGFRLFILSTILSASISQVNASGSRRPLVSPSQTTPPVVNIPIPLNSQLEIVNPNYANIDKDHEVPKALLNKAINYYQNNKSLIKNKTTLGIIDFSQHNSKERFYLVDMFSGTVDKYLVAHGKNSDPDYDGFATIFSNTPGSEMSSQGFYLTAETYEGSHGYSLRLDGLSLSNSNARSREIVIHPASYVQPGSKIGRSWGCPAIDPRFSEEIINRIKGGVLIYAQ